MKYLKFVRDAYLNLRRTLNQRGEGVLTRRQAQAEVQNNNRETSETINNTNQENTSEHNDETQEQMDIEPSVDNNYEVENTSNSDKPSDDDLFNSETLIAENDLVKAYIIKDYFKRQKIFK